MTDSTPHQDKNSSLKNSGKQKDDMQRIKEEYQATKEETQTFLQRILDKI